MGLNLRLQGYGNDLVAMDVSLENGEKVSVLPYALVTWQGARYVVATILTRPKEAVVLIEAGERLFQIVGSVANKVLQIANKHIAK